MPIGCYLPFDPLNNFLCIILDYKNLKFKYLIGNINIDLLSFLNFANMEDLKKKLNGGFVKIHI